MVYGVLVCEPHSAKCNTPRPSPLTNPSVSQLSFIDGRCVFSEVLSIVLLSGLGQQRNVIRLAPSPLTKTEHVSHT